MLGVVLGAGALGDRGREAVIDEKLQSLRVELQERSARPYVWLDVSYNGKYPPIELFADLEMVGWDPPAPAPPPRSAIDWSTPNEATGDPFSIIDYFIDDVISAPPGTGERGRWTAGERAAYLKGLEGVLRRHDLTSAPMDTLPPPPALAASAAAAGEVVPPSAPRPPTRAEPAPVAATALAPPPVAAEVAPADGPSPDDTRLVHVEAMLVAGTKQTAIEALTSLDLPVKVEQRERTKTVQFRGSTSTTTEMGQVLVTVVPANEVHRITAILVNANAVVSEDDFTVGNLRADALNAFLNADPVEAAPSASASAPEPAAPRPTQATVTIVVATTMFEYLAGLAVDCGGTIVESAPAQKIKRMHHRGSVREEVVAGVRGVIVIPPADLDGLLKELKASGLAIDDPDEVSVERPAPPSPPAPAPAEPAAAVSLPTPPAPQPLAPASVPSPPPPAAAAGHSPVALTTTTMSM